MKVLGVIALLVGCNTGYQVRSYTITQQKAVFVCEKRTPMFQFDITLKMCESMEECNQFCKEVSK